MREGGRGVGHGYKGSRAWRTASGSRKRLTRMEWSARFHGRRKWHPSWCTVGTSIVAIHGVAALCHVTILSVLSIPFFQARWAAN